MAQSQRRIQNPVVGVVADEDASDTVGIDTQDDSDTPRRFAERDAAFGGHVAGERIKFPQKLACLGVDIAAALLEPIQLFEDRDRNRDVVLVKIEDAGRIVQDDVRVEDEQLDLSGRRDGIRRTRPCVTDHARLPLESESGIRAPLGTCTRELLPASIPSSAVAVQNWPGLRESASGDNYRMPKLLVSAV